MTDNLLFTKDEWDAALPDVVQRMTAYLKSYRTPVFEDLDGHGTGCGSGSYIRLGERIFILTNEHVSELRRSGRKLIYQLAGQDVFRPIVGNHVELQWPYDLALLPVDEDAWKNSSHQSRAISIEQIAYDHDPVLTEILTFVGFSGQEAKFIFDTLHSTATCFSTAEVPLPEDPRFSSHFHLGLAYPPDLATIVSGGKDLPVPPGLSGSTLWNTRFVEATMAGTPWQPDMARVTGVVWGWPSSVGCLVVTRAEYLRSFLLGAFALVQKE